MESHDCIVTSGELGCKLCLFLCGSVQGLPVCHRRCPGGHSLQCQLQMSDFLICSYPDPHRASQDKSQCGLCCLLGGLEHRLQVMPYFGADGGGTREQSGCSARALLGVSQIPRDAAG